MQDQCRSHVASQWQKNGTYASPQIRNEGINICGFLVKTALAKDLRKLQVFRLLADDNADISGKEQLSIRVRRYGDG